MAELSTPVRGVLPATDTPLSGVGQIGYGITVGSTGASEDWLVAGGTQGGVWTLTTPANTWARRTDLDTSAEFNNMPYVQVREGNQGVAGSVWYYSGSQNPTINSSQLPFTMREFGRPALAGNGLDANFPYLQLPAQLAAEGEYSLGIFNTQISERGVSMDFDVGTAGEMLISGMGVEPSGPLALDVYPGAAYVPARGNMVEQTVLTDSAYVLEDESGGLQASKLYHLYASHEGDPLSPYYYLSPLAPVTDNNIGPPYVKGPSASKNRARRYLQSVRTDATPSFYTQRVQVMGNVCRVRYIANANASPFLVLSGGAATTEAPVSCAGVVPPTARTAKLRVQSTTVGAVFGNSEDGITLSGSVYLQRISQGAPIEMDLPLDASQALTYMLLGTGTLDVQVLGYYERR
jgi:hypothetical protein